MPWVDDAGKPVTLSPEEQTYVDKATTATATATASAGSLVDETGKPVDPFSLSASDLASLVKSSPDKFDLVSQFSARPDLQKDPQMVDKVADAFHQIRQQPTDWKHLLYKAPENITNVIAGLARFGGKAVSGTGKELVSGAAGALGAPEDVVAAGQEESRQELGQAAASTETGMTGLVHGVMKTLGAVGRGLHLTKSLKDYDQNDKVNALFDALGTAQQTQKNLSGHGPLAQAITGGAVPVNPQETAKLADPFSWEALGGATKLAGMATRAAGSVVPDITAKLPSVPQVAGAVIQGAAKAGATGARLVEKAATPVGTVAAPLYALATHDPRLLAESLLFGSKAAETAAETAEKAATGLDAAAEFGKRVATGEVKGAYEAAVRDALEAAPKAAANLAAGVGFDLSQVAGADTPQEREAAVGLGSAFGLLGAASSAGRHIISGQIVGPRSFDISAPARPSSALPALEAVNTSAWDTLTPGQKTRLNAIRLFLGKANPNAEVFAADPNNREGLSKALQQHGMAAPAADFYANQNGFTTDLGGKKVIVTFDPAAAPHEAFHGIEDVLGEGKMRELEQATQQQYSPQWDDFGKYYAERLSRGGSQDWIKTILDRTGWGNRYAGEKLFANEAKRRLATGEPLDERQIKDSVLQQGPIDWKVALTPEEQQTVANRYVAREILAENFDAWFKHAGPNLEPGRQMPERVATAIGNVMRFFGVNPLAGRTSEGLGVGLKPESIETVAQAGREAAGNKPVIEPTPKEAAAPAGAAPTQNVADIARRLAAEQPNVPLPGGNMTQREIAGAAAEAFATDSALHLQYSTAPEEPAASLALGMNRADRRSMIEAFRNMPDIARKLFGKVFFPKKFVNTKSSGIQIQGWSPEVFAANAHRWGRFIAELAAKNPDAARDLSRYETDERGLTATGWQDLYNDLQNYVKNQRAGLTGAGQKLVVPKRVTDAGYFAPPTVGEAGEQLPQEKSDVINMLFGFRLPGTEGKPTRAGGGATRLPQNIAGRLVSEATRPGRVTVPVEPRGEFGGKAAEAQGVAGEPVMEVNPYRAALEQAAKDAGVKAPSMIESWQNLNLNRIKEAEGAPEQPKFGANPLTLQAGFMPGNPDVARVADDYSKNSGIGSIRKSAAAPINESTARKLADFYQAATHAPNAPDVKRSYDALGKETVAQYEAIQNAGYKIEPFTGKGEPYSSSAEMAADVRDNKHLYYLPTTGNFGGPTDNLMLRPSGIGNAPLNDIFRAVHDFFGHAKEGYQFGPRGEFNAWREHSQMFSPEAQGALAAETLAQNSWVNFGPHLRTGEAGAIPQKGEPGYVEPAARPFAEQKNMIVPSEMIANSQAQFSPKTFIVRHGSTEMNNANPDKDLIRGHINVPLDAKGRREATESANQIKEQGGVQHIVTSDLDRAVDTAKAIQKANPGATITEDAGLRPWNFGPTIEGKPTSEMLPKIKALTENPDKRPPDGETFNEFKDRFLEAFHRAQDATQDANAAIVTHYRGTKLLDAWRATGVDNDNIDKAIFEAYDKSKTPGNVDVIDKLGELRTPKSVKDLTRQEGDKSAILQAMPEAIQNRKSKTDWTLKEGPGMFSKAWITPDGKPIQLGGQWHHEWVNENPDVAKRYGLTATTSGEENRSQALQKGFARVNYEKNTGTLKVEARAKDWSKLAPAVQEMVQNNLRKIDNMDVHLLDPKAKKIVDQDGVALHTYEPEERMDQIPFIGKSSPTTTFSEQAPSLIGGQYLPKSEPRALRSAAVRDPETGQIFEAPIHAMAVQQALGLPTYAGMGEKAYNSFEHGFTTNEGEFLNRAEAAMRAAEMKQLQEGIDLQSNRQFQRKGGIGVEHLQNRVLTEMNEKNLPRDAARQRAARELTGKVEQVIPAYLKIENPVVLDRAPGPIKRSNRSTLFNYEYDEGTGQESGSSVDLYNSIMRVAAEHGVDGQKLWNKITQNGADDLSAYDVWKEIQQSDEAMYGNDPQGRMMGSEIARQVFQDMGFDGIELTRPAEEFPNMNIDPDAKHFVVFNPEQVKGVKNRGTFGVQDPRFQFMPKAEHAEFKDPERIENALTGKQYGIVTATRESQGDANNDVNRLANENLEKALIADGYNPIPAGGDYKGVDQGRSFIVPGMTDSDAKRYGQLYGQESVITPKGLIFSDGSGRMPITGVVTGDEAKRQDGWTQAEGGIPFSFNFGDKTAQLMPQNLQLGGFEKKEPLSTKQLADMSNTELKAHYPEAIIANQKGGKDPAISSDIVGSPLYKQAGSEENAVREFGDRLADEARKYEDSPEYQSGLKWYSDFVPALKKEFGKDAQLMAELLAATSPQNAPEANFAYALDALEGLKSGRFDKMISKYNEGLTKLADGRLEDWYNRQVKAGKVIDPPATPSEATYLAQWISQHDLIPRQSNGARYGLASEAVLQVFARRWLEQTQGPKTQNFVKNLLGTGHEATVDVWADRTMRRLGYEGFQDRWRILPRNATGVTDADFAFSQKVFRHAAEQLGIEPDALQGAMWFAEKKLWSDNGWGRLDLGDFRKEIAKTPMLRQGIRQRLETQRQKAKAETLVEPRLL